MSAPADVRRTNWWYVLPEVTGPVLVVGDADQAATFPDRFVTPADHASATAALNGGRYEAVAVPDLDRVVDRGNALAFLQTVSGAISPSGWLYGGFSNRPLKRGGLSVTRLRRLLRAAGLGNVHLYLVAPDHVTPAYLIPAERRAELNFFLRVLFFPYSRAPGTRGALKRLALRILWVGASVSPARARAFAWPSAAFVATRRSP